MKINTQKIYMKLGKGYTKKKSGYLLLSLCMANLIGCQTTNTPLNTSHFSHDQRQSIVSHDDYQQQLSTQTELYKQQLESFEEQGVDAKARLKLLNAIKQHLETDHVSVTQTRVYARPFIKEGSVDALSESALKSFLTFAADYYETLTGDEYLDNDDYEPENYSEDSDGEGFYGPAYRTKEEYLDDDSVSDLYLNYIDEQKDINNLNTNEYVDKQTGMSEDFQAATNRAIEYSEQTYDCVLDYSETLDDLVLEDPSVNKDSKNFKDATNRYYQCINGTKKDYSNIFGSATGYQRVYIEKTNSCKGRFDTQLTDLMNPARQPKLIDYDEYDSIFESYAVCDWGVVNLRDLEPAHYTNEAWPKYILDYKQDIIECANTLTQSQDKAALEGITYKTDSDTLASIYHDSTECQDIAEYIKYESEATEAEMSAGDSNERSRGYKEAIDNLFTMFKLSPAQIQASNFYLYQYITLNQITEFNAKAKQVNSVYSYDFASPTSYTSIQLPIGLDFNTATMKLDPSAILPLMALMSPEHTPLPEEMISTTIDFNLPEKISSKVPANIIYDAFIEALSHSMSELDSGYFTEMDIRNDAYAKQIGAHSAVKVNLDSKQSGKLLGIIVKHMANSIEDYIDTHPEKYEDDEIVKVALKKWQEANKKFQSEDVGKFLQLIEAIGPLSFNRMNYYYFDSKGQLIGKQNSTTMGGDYMGASSNTLSQTQFNNQNFNKHPLNQLFLESFGQPYKNDNPKGLDGNSLLKKIKQRKERLEQAEFARYEYATDEGEYSSDEYSESNNSRDVNNTEDANNTESVDTVVDEDDYQPSIQIVDYGNVNDY